MEGAAAAFAVAPLQCSRVSRRRARLRCAVTPARADDAQYERQANARATWALAERARGAEMFWSELGTGAASAFASAYPADVRVLVMCGPGRNGRVGERTASALSMRGFDVTAYVAAADAPAALGGAQHLSFLPSTAGYYWDVMVDAVLGVGYDGGDVRDSAAMALDFVATSQLPTCALDVPSGWDVDGGPRKSDDVFVRPDVLVSLGSAKPCAKRFAGRAHYLFDWEEGGDARLVWEKDVADVFGNGEEYGRAGQFQATLFSKTEERRVWVYPEDEESGADIWDEID